MLKHLENTMRRELEALEEKYRGGQELAESDLRRIDLLAHSLKSLVTYCAMKDSYSSTEYQNDMNANMNNGLNNMSGNNMSAMNGINGMNGMSNNMNANMSGNMVMNGANDMNRYMSGHYPMNQYPYQERRW